MRHVAAKVHHLRNAKAFRERLEVLEFRPDSDHGQAGFSPVRDRPRQSLDRKLTALPGHQAADESSRGSLPCSAGAVRSISLSRSSSRNPIAGYISALPAASAGNIDFVSWLVVRIFNALLAVWRTVGSRRTIQLLVSRVSSPTAKRALKLQVELCWSVLRRHRSDPI